MFFISSLDSYVKVALMSSSGFEMTKSKTSVRRGQPHPTFKETFIFQVNTNVKWNLEIPKSTMIAAIDIQISLWLHVEVEILQLCVCVGGGYARGVCVCVCVCVLWRGDTGVWQALGDRTWFSLCGRVLVVNIMGTLCQINLC